VKESIDAQIHEPPPTWPVDASPGAEVSLLVHVEIVREALDRADPKSPG
jgi:hypothetical protein